MSSAVLEPPDPPDSSNPSKPSEPSNPSDPSDRSGQGSSSQGASSQGIGDLGPLDFDLPSDFVVPDDISELDWLPPARGHEGLDGSVVWDDDAAPAGADAASKGPGGAPASGTPGGDTPTAAGGPAGPGSGNNVIQGSAIGGDAGLEAELAAMSGEKPDLAVLVTSVIEARALAAACVLAGIRATAIPSATGALAVLRDPAGKSQSKDAAAIASMMPEMPVLLITKAAGQLTAERFHGGRPVQEVPAGLVVAGASGILDDLIVGAVTPDQIPEAVSTEGVSRAKALVWLSASARRGRRQHG